MNIFDYFQKKGIDTLSSTFYTKIAVWDSWYKGNVKKFHQYRIYGGQGTYTKCHRHSLGMAKKVSEDMADLLLNERVKITIADKATDAYVKRVLDENNFNLLGNEYQERKASTGTVAYIPYLADMEIDSGGSVLSGTVKINYIEARNIFPITWENGRIIECAFLFPKTCSRKRYAQIQFHRKENDQYVITNAVVQCSSGAGMELTKEEWSQIPAFEGLAERIETGSDMPQFVIDRLNIVNNADDDDTNPMGVALFANAIDVLRKIDLEYDSYASEFSLGRKRIFVAPEMLTDNHGNPAFDTDDTVFYRLPEEYVTKAADVNPIKEVNMTLRVDEHSRAINDDLNYLSLKCGFGTQRYKFEQGGVKTATEVISENSDMYRMLRKHEIILDAVMRELIRVIIRLGLAAREPDLKEAADITINFDDSIIEDKQTERNEDRKDVSMGAMRLSEYRAKWYAETEEAAAAKLPEQTGVMP